MKVRRLAAMSSPEVLPGGNLVTFVMKDSEGGASKYQLSTDALDTIIANLETLASMALAQRMDRDAQMFEPNPAVPPTVVHPDYFQVEALSTNAHELVLRRRGRSQIRATLSPETLQNFQTAMMAEPENPTKN